MNVKKELIEANIAKSKERMQLPESYSDDERMVASFLIRMARTDVNDIGHMLLSPDPQHHEEAMASVQEQFKDYRSEHGKS